MVLPKVAVLVRHFFKLWLMIYHPVSKTVKCLNLLMMEQYGNEVLI